MAIGEAGRVWVPMMGRMVQVAAPTTPEDGLPAKLRDEILARACACLPEVLQRSAEFVERRHIDIDKGLDPGKTRAVATLAGRDAALKRAAVRQAINEIIEELRDPVSSGRSPESPHVIKILRWALFSDEKLDNFFPLTQVQTRHTMLKFGRGERTRKLDEAVRGARYA